MPAYHLVKVIGKGTEDDPFRPAISDNRSWAALMPTNALGHPVSQWALVTTKDNAAVPSDGATLGAKGKGDVLLPTERDALNRSVNARLGRAPSAPATATFGEVIREVGRMLDPAFHEDRLVAR